MVRTRGGSSKADRVRPTTFVIRKRGDLSNSLQNKDFEDNVEHKEVEIGD